MFLTDSSHQSRVAGRYLCLGFVWRGLRLLLSEHVASHGQHLAGQEGFGLCLGALQLDFCPLDTTWSLMLSHIDLRLAEVMGCEGGVGWPRSG